MSWLLRLDEALNLGSKQFVHNTFTTEKQFWWFDNTILIWEGSRQWIINLFACWQPLGGGKAEGILCDSEGLHLVYLLKCRNILSARVKLIPYRLEITCLREQPYVSRCSIYYLCGCLILTAVKHQTAVFSFFIFAIIYADTIQWNIYTLLWKSLFQEHLEG